MIGERIGHFIIIEQLGKGGMGEVWLAEDSQLDRLVALKSLPHHTASDETDRARFIQEAKAAARLKHPNIAQVYEIHEDAGRLFIVMEYVEGGSLKDRLRSAEKKPLPLENILEWARQSAEGLAAAHKQGIVHRDIKPENLMLDSDNRIKITDFGLARVISETSLTTSGTTLGTARYMSPEQIRGEKVDHRSDLFSLGVTLYELLTNTQPFHGPDVQAVYFSILTSTPKSPSRLRPDLPAELDKVVSSLLEKNLDERTASASELLDSVMQLQELLGFTVISRKTESVLDGKWKFQQSNISKIFLAGGAIAIVALLALLVWPGARSSQGTGYWVNRDSWPVQIEFQTPGVEVSDSDNEFIARALVNRLLEVFGNYQKAISIRRESGIVTESGFRIESQLATQGTEINFTVVVSEVSRQKVVFRKTYPIARGASTITVVEGLATPVIRDVMLGIGLPIPDEWAPNLGLMQPQSDRVAATVDQAQRYLKEGLPDLAEEVLRSAIDAGNQDPILNFYLGRCLASQDRWDEAARDFGLALPVSTTSEIAKETVDVKLPRDIGGKPFHQVLASTPDAVVLLIGDAWEVFYNTPLSSMAVSQGSREGWGWSTLVGLDCPNGNILWQLPMSSETFSTYRIFTQSNNTLFLRRIRGTGPVISAIDIATGQEQWVVPIEDIDDVEGFTLHGDILIGTGDAWLVAFSSTTGEKLWGPIYGLRNGIGSSGQSEPAGIFENIAVTETEGNRGILAIVDLETGNKNLVSFPLAVDGWRALIENMLIQGNPRDGELTGYNLSTLRQQWRLRDPRLRGLLRDRPGQTWLNLNKHESTLPGKEVFYIPDDGSPIRAFLPTENSGLTALEFRNGISSKPRILWGYRSPDFEFPSAYISWTIPDFCSGEYLYLPSSDSRAKILDVLTGELVLSIELNQLRWGVLKGPRQTTILAGEQKLVLMDGSEIVWQRFIPGLQMIIPHGSLLYLALSDGTIKILDVIDGSLLANLRLGSAMYFDSDWLNHYMAWNHAQGFQPQILLSRQDLLTEQGGRRILENFRFSILQHELQRGSISRAEVLTSRAEALWRNGQLTEAQESIDRALLSPGIEQWRFPLLEMEMKAAESDTVGLVRAATSVYQLTEEGAAARESVLTKLRDLVGIEWIVSGYAALFTSIHTVSSFPSILLVGEHPTSAIDIETGSQLWSESASLDKSSIGSPLILYSYNRSQEEGQVLHNWNARSIDILTGNRSWTKTLTSLTDSNLTSLSPRAVWPEGAVVLHRVPETEDILILEPVEPPRLKSGSELITRENALTATNLYRFDPITGTRKWNRAIRLDHESHSGQSIRLGYLIASEVYTVVQTPEHASGIMHTSSSPGRIREVKTGDVILEADGQPLWGLIHLRHLMARAVSDSILLHIRRENGDEEYVFAERKPDFLPIQYSTNQQFLVLNTATGDSVSRFELKEPFGKIRDMKLHGDSGILIAEDGGDFTYIDLTTGNHLWQFGPVSQNVVSDNYYPTTDYLAGDQLVDWGSSPTDPETGTVFNLSLVGDNAGSINWILPFPGHDLREIAADENYTAVISRNAEKSNSYWLSVIDTQSGGLLNSTPVPNWIPRSMCISGTCLIVATDKGYIYRINLLKN